MILNVFIICVATALITGIGSTTISLKKCKNEINTLEKNNKHEIEKLMRQHEVDIESLKEKHTKATPRLSDEELKDKKEAERTTAKHEAYEKAVEKYCNEVGYSRLDYQTHEFYADRGQREHLPPEKLNPNKK